MTVSLDSIANGELIGWADAPIARSAANRFIFGASGPVIGTGGIVLQTADTMGWSDAIILREAANTVAMRNGTNPQVVRVYNTYTSGSVYERGFARWTSNIFEVGPEQLGATERRAKFILRTTGNDYITSLNTNTASIFVGGGEALYLTAFAAQLAGWNAGAGVSLIGNGPFPGVTNRAGDPLFLKAMGGSGNGNPGYVGIWAAPTGASGTTGHTAEEAIRISVPSTGVALMQFNGATSSFPALKRSSAVLQARLADDSAFAAIQGKLQTDNAYSAGDPTTTGYILVYDSTGTAYRIPAVLHT